MESEGVYELHWRREPHTPFSCVLYRRADLGQLALVGTFDLGPFDTMFDVSKWLVRNFALDSALPKA